MKRLFLRRLVLFVMPLVVAVLAFSTVLAQSERLCVCHLEDKDSGRGHVIEVDENALDGHLRHGDTQCSVDCDELIGETCSIASGGECSDRTD